MSVIGISGAQGAGKSSILAELQARGLKIDSFKVSRTIQEELGWGSLSEVMSNFNNMTMFQQRILDRKVEHDQKLLSNDVILTERTFADIWAYTSMWAWRLHDQNKVKFDDVLKFLIPYTNDCAAAQNQIYSSVVLVPLMDHIVFENDPNRASESDADSVYDDIILFINRRTPLMKTHRISTKSVSDRADEVQTFIKGF